MFNLKDYLNYPFNNPIFAQYLNSDPSALLKVCSKMQKHINEISRIGQKILLTELMPNLSSCYENGHLEGYDYHKASLVLAKDLNPKISEQRLKDFLTSYVQDPLVKMRTWIYKLAESHFEFPFIKQALISSEGDEIKINPLLWIANVPNPSLLRTLLTNGKTGLSTNALSVINEFISKAEQNRQTPTTIPQILFPDNVEASLSLLKEIAHLEIPFLNQRLAQHLIPFIDHSTVTQLMVEALLYKNGLLSKGCFKFIKQEVGLELSFNSNWNVEAIFPEESSESAKAVLESLAESIQNIGFKSFNGVEELQQHLLSNNLPLKNVHTVAVKSQERMPDIQTLVPNARQLLLGPKVPFEKMTPWISIETLEIQTPLTEDAFLYFKKIFPNLKIIIQGKFIGFPYEKDEVLILPPRSAESLIFFEREQSLITNEVITNIVPRYTNLNWLLLEAATQITDADLIKLAQNCKKIRGLFLGAATQITDAGLIKFAQNRKWIWKLNLGAATQITDASVKELAQNCKDLDMLKLEAATQITDASVKELAQNCKGIRMLNLGAATQITDASVKELAQNCKWIRMLNLGAATQITDASVKELAQNCKNLMKLNLGAATQITDASVKELAQNCKGIWMLNLGAATQITDDSVRELVQNCKALYILELPNTISSETITFVKKQLPGCMITQGPKKREATGNAENQSTGVAVKKSKTESE